MKYFLSAASTFFLDELELEILSQILHHVLDVLSTERVHKENDWLVLAGLFGHFGPLFGPQRLLHRSERGIPTHELLMLAVALQGLVLIILVLLVGQVLTIVVSLFTVLAELDLVSVCVLVCEVGWRASPKHLVVVHFRPIVCIFAIFKLAVQIFVIRHGLDEGSPSPSPSFEFFASRGLRASHLRVSLVELDGGVVRRGKVTTLAELFHFLIEWVFKHHGLPNSLFCW
mmetsp:Transcript_74/g.144  ORF Transcript_74/g.144 Transcript_74/m.144 type:complete len:229 (+) Transcript_74:727-1413(+)